MLPFSHPLRMLQIVATTAPGTPLEDFQRAVEATTPGTSPEDLKQAVETAAPGFPLEAEHAVHENTFEDHLALDGRRKSRHLTKGHRVLGRCQAPLAP